VIGSVGFCELVYRSNLFAMVSGGSRPKYADNAILIYDDLKHKGVIEFTFSQPVLSVRCRRDRVVSVHMSEIHVFSMCDRPQKLLTIPTRHNPLGLCELSVGVSSILVFPGTRIGSLHIVVSSLLTFLLVLT